MPTKSVPIVLKDGKTRQFRLEWQNICRLDREHKISIFDFGRDAIFGQISPVKITGIIWAGLLPDEPTLTFEKVEKELMAFEDFQKYMDIITEAIPQFLPEAEKQKEPGKKA